MGHPLRLFGKVDHLNKGSFFQPYIPLQQLNVLESKDTKSFLVGANNSIFLTQKSLDIDVIANVDTGNIDIINPDLAPLLSLTIPDKKFMHDLFINSKKREDEMDTDSHAEDVEYEGIYFFKQGSDDYIRASFEHYFTSLLVSVKHETKFPEHSSKVYIYLQAF